MLHRLPTRPVLLLALLVLPAVAVAHGISTTITHGPAVIVTVTYDGGPPLSDEVCEIFPPGDDAVFQTGRTDHLGRVIFAPDRPGTWLVKVVTADGHGAEVEVEVDADLLVGNTGEVDSRGTASKLIIGLIVLSGVFGVLGYLKQRTA